jgi:hypothetical protein
VDVDVEGASAPQLDALWNGGEQDDIGEREG